MIYCINTILTHGMKSYINQIIHEARNVQFLETENHSF